MLTMQYTSRAHDRSLIVVATVNPNRAHGSIPAGLGEHPVMRPNFAETRLVDGEVVGLHKWDGVTQFADLLDPTK
jgi:hypothetical protein